MLTDCHSVTPVHTKSRVIDQCELNAFFVYFVKELTFKINSLQSGRVKVLFFRAEIDVKLLLDKRKNVALIYLTRRNEFQIDMGSDNCH